MESKQKSDSDEMLVAVATKGDGQINMHFGHADDFAIYRVGVADVQLLEVRPVVELGDEDKRDAIIRVLADCKALFVARAGDGPKAKLIEAGIEPVDSYAFGPIETSIKEWYAGKQA